MKVTFTYNEILEMARLKYDLPDNAKIEITELPVESNYIEGIIRITRKEFSDGSYLNHNKIAAIKRLRELVGGLGLAEAKAAVENPEKAIMHYLAFRTPYQLFGN